VHSKYRQRDPSFLHGLTTFEKEWVHWYLLQYMVRWCIMLLEIARELSSCVRHTNVMPPFPIWLLNAAYTCMFLMHLDRSRTTEEDYSTRDLGVLMSTTWNIEFTNDSAFAVINTANHVCNLENSNVTCHDTGDQENYQSLTAKYLDRYSSTGTKANDLNIGQSVYIDASINMIKYEIMDRSIYRDPDSNCGCTET